MNQRDMNQKKKSPTRTAPLISKAKGKGGRAGGKAGNRSTTRTPRSAPPPPQESSAQVDIDETLDRWMNEEPDPLYMQTILDECKQFPDRKPCSIEELNKILGNKDPKAQEELRKMIHVFRTIEIKFQEATEAEINKRKDVLAELKGKTDEERKQILKEYEQQIEKAAKEEIKKCMKLNQCNKWNIMANMVTLVLFLSSLYAMYRAVIFIGATIGSYIAAKTGANGLVEFVNWLASRLMTFENGMPENWKKVVQALKLASNPRNGMVNGVYTRRVFKTPWEFIRALYVHLEQSTYLVEYLAEIATMGIAAWKARAVPKKILDFSGSVVGFVAEVPVYFKTLSSYLASKLHELYRNRTITRELLDAGLSEKFRGNASLQQQLLSRATGAKQASKTTSHRHRNIVRMVLTQTNFSQ